MRPLSLTGVRRALIVAPHADDEVIGAFGLIRALLRRRAQVRVLVVTDGTASHPNSQRWPSRRLAAERQAETRRAMLRLGVPADAVRFLGLPDSGLHLISVGQRRRVASAIASSRADLLVLPRADDYHSDHQAVAALAREIRMPARRIAYLVWPQAHHPRPTRTRTVPVSHALPMKRQSIQSYRTQTGMIRDDPKGFEIDRALLARFARPVELFEPIR